MEQNKKIEKEDQSAFSIKKQIIYIVVFVALIALTFYAIVSQNENLTVEGWLADCSSNVCIYVYPA